MPRLNPVALEAINLRAIVAPINDPAETAARADLSNKAVTELMRAERAKAGV